ncbi:hypothetical protein BT63DRAFT_366617 [Microthyrium microscopicum]|uniref:U4/U6 snRNA-associated-splicing factor PRP24 n=1 Tax=Microthyrium microscopicum TaxID=703497 RepID=A0A6A6UVQ6_9PEZI|nr:hypothetical protein BT63DRAFT_366617 [Microthyrium microscopicum]
MIPDAPKGLPPPALHTYGASSLTVQESHTLAEQAKQLNEDRLKWDVEKDFVKLLHIGLSRHIESGNEARTYELLRDLRHAREFMDEVIPVGEDLWIDWLTDENLLAKSLEDRINLMELHSRAVREEPSSAQLWRQYGDFMYYLYTCSNRPDDGDSPGWPADDKMAGQQLFTWAEMLKVWEHGIENTHNHINDGNQVWDRYMEIRVSALSKQSAPEEIQAVHDLFTSRLIKDAHMTWDQTFGSYSSFVTAFANDQYEELMIQVSQRSQQVKKSYSLREPFEFKIQQAIEKEDKPAEYDAYTDYLAWELRMSGPFSLETISALYARATTRFHTDAALWIGYVGFLIEQSKPGHNQPLHGVLQRANRRCPFSGELWAQRLLAMEVDNSSFQDIEAIKHLATSSLKVDQSGLEDLLTVYIAWCGYLRRRATASGGEDEHDVAEVGIRSALENYRKAGEKVMGKDFRGDPSYRLERIHLRVLFQRNDVAGCRAVWKEVSKQQADSYDFWYRYYIFAMIVWGRSDPTQSPKEPTNILRQGLKRVETMDSPELLIEMYLNHCEQHESVEDYRRATIDVRKAKKRVAERREKETAAQWEAYYKQQAEQNAAQEHAAEVQDGASRKRSAEEDHPDGQSSKKQKAKAEPNNDVAMAEPEAAAEPLKRDREHTVIIVKNIPKDATDLDVRKFFRDCGTVNSIKLKPEKGSQTATVEFETVEDARFAQTKVAKPMGDNQLEIEFAVGTTLYVTNYPPTADDKFIRGLFKDFGEVVDVRFPSLQGNTRRRFCYVQFVDPDQAQKATEIDGQVLDDQYHLSVKVSDPTRKENRHGAIEEGREVVVHNLNWKASEEDVKALFSDTGTVEKVRIPRNMTGQSKGTAFITYSTKAEAEKSVETFHNTPFQSRTLRVEVAVPRAKRTLTTVLRGSTHSASPDPSTNGDAMQLDGEDDASNYKARSLAILNVPDTVNAARLQALLGGYGTIKKFSLRPDHGGAIVEFTEIKSVGEAELGLENTELDGVRIRTGSVPELMKSNPTWKRSRLGERDRTTENGPANTSSSGTAKTTSFAPGPRVARPAPKRGGLGKKTGLGFRKTAGEQNGDGNGGAKSNAEFRAMFLKGKEDGEPAENKAGENQVGE